MRGSLASLGQAVRVGFATRGVPLPRQPGRWHYGARVTSRLATCETCGNDLPPTGPAQSSVGRPRRYCSQRCRQRAYRDRTGPTPVADTAAPLSEDVIAIRRAWLADLADQVYQLDCAVQDIRTALDENATRAELLMVCRNLVDSARSLRPALRRLPAR
jgi:hypothetical protein